MPLTLPKLDDRAYADLLEEARTLIPSFYPAWTDHNPTDPGITLIELFAWLSELLIYRTDQVPNRHRLAFLKLLNGPSAQLSLLAGATGLDDATRQRLLDLLYAPSQGAPAVDLVDSAVRATVVELRRRNRAVTTEDFEALALAAVPDIARTTCIPRRDLDGGTEAARLANRSGHISVIVVPNAFRITDQSLVALTVAGLPDAMLQALGTLRDQELIGEQAFTDLLKTVISENALAQFRSPILRAAQAPAPQPSAEQRQAIWNDLDDRRELTVRHHVVGPFYAPVSTDILLARRADSLDDAVRATVVQMIGDFLHPLHGGPDGTGWPFGRDVYLSELYALLETVPGVDYVPDITVSSDCEPGAVNCVVAQQLWHDNGDQIGLRLAAHHLPRARIDPTRIVVAATYVPVRFKVKVQLNDDPNIDAAAVRRAIKNALRNFFHPLHGGPNGTAGWAITLAALSPDDQTELQKHATLYSLETLRALVRQVGGKDTGDSLVVDTDERWRIRGGLGNVIAVGSRQSDPDKNQPQQPLGLADVQVTLL